MKILNGVTFFFPCVTACFSLQMCDNHAKCVILAGLKYAFVAMVTASMATNFSVNSFTISVNQILFLEHLLYSNYLQ